MHTVYNAPAREPATLDLPFYGASFGASVRRFFRKYAVFTGRASRSEFWWAMLFQYIVGTIAGLGAIGYELALRAAAHHLATGRK